MAGNAPLSVTLNLIDRATAPLKQFSATVKGAVAPFREIKNRMKLVSTDLGLPAVGKAVSGVGRAAGGVAREIKGIAKELMVVGTAVAGLVSGIVYTTTSAGDAAYKTAQKVGVSTEAWTKMNHAASMSNVSSEELKRGLSELNDMTTKAANGNKQAQARFRALGIEYRDASGNLKPANVLFEEAAGRLAGIEDPARRARGAAVLFGKELGPLLVPLLSAGQEGIQAYYEEAERLGKVITDEQGEAAVSFNDSVARVKDAVLGLTYAIGNQLLPILEPWINYLEVLIADNRELISEKVSEWIDKIGEGFEAFRPHLVAVWEGIVTLATWIDSVVQSFGGWAEVLPYVAAAIAAIHLAPLIISVGVLTKAVIGLGIALLTTPIGWITLGIAAVVGAFVYLWRNCEGFRNFWIAMWEKVKDYVLGAVQRVRDAFDKGIIQGLLAILLEFNPLKIFTSALGGVIDYFMSLDLGFGNVIAKILYAIAEFNPVSLFIKTMGKVVDYLSSFSLLEVGSKLLGSLWEGLKKAWDDITGWFSGLADTIAGLIPTSLTDVLDTAKSIAGGVSSVASSVAGTVGDAASSAWNWLTGGDDSPAEEAASFQVKDVMPEQVSPAAQLGRVLVEFLNVPDAVRIKTGGGVDVHVQRDLSSMAYMGGGLRQ